MAELGERTISFTFDESGSAAVNGGSGEANSDGGDNASANGEARLIFNA